MSDTHDNGQGMIRTTPIPMMVETSVGERPVTSVDLTTRPADGSKNKAVTNRNRGMTADLDPNGGEARIHESDRDGVGDNGEGAQEGEVREDGQEGQEGDEGSSETLPKFDADNADTVAEYDAVFLTDTGAPNLAQFSQDFFKGGEKLSDNHYAYLASKGYDKATVDEVIAGQLARRDTAQQAIVQRAGGKANLESAVKWGATGGYTPAQKARFNQAMQSSDPEVVAEAVDALMLRYRQTPAGRRANPVRTVAGNAGGGGSAPSGVQPYASHAEWQADIRKARAEGNQALLDQSRRRLKASPWYNNSGKK